MNLLNFADSFPDEDSCKAAFKKHRELQGVICPKCGSKEHYWLKGKEAYQCKYCKTRQSLRSHTLMHGSHLPFRYWFISMHLLTATKKSFSALELQRQLKHKRYEPVWLMMHKLRDVMGQRDDRYELNGTVEFDEGFFTTERNTDEPLKRGRGSQRKTKVAVMAESVPVKEVKTKKGKDRKVGYIKMLVIDDLKAETIDNVVRGNINKDAVIDSDASSSYTNLKTIVKEHRPKVIPETEVGKVLPYVHISISNAKRMLLDVHHCIAPQYLQNYLNEFCYKFNRRYFDENLFDRLLVACVSYRTGFRYNRKNVAGLETLIITGNKLHSTTDNNIGH